MAPKVSVCICVYKAEAYIEKCARSLFEQTMQEGLEFIFVNDCTPDKSFDVLATVLEEYPHRKAQVKVIHLEQNGGVANARKVAMRAATGEYIIHCDPDDWVDKTIYEKLYSKAKETNADMVYCNSVSVYTTGKTEPRILGDFGCKEDIIKALILRCQKMSSVPWDKLYRRSIIEKINLDLLHNEVTIGEDLILNIMLISSCAKIEKCCEKLYFYCKTDSSLTSNWRKSINVKRNFLYQQYNLDEIIKESQYDFAMESSRRLALYTAISSGVTTAREWHRLWKTAKRGMWRDKRWNIAQKLIFYAACINFTLTSFVFKLLTGRLKEARQ